MSFYEILQKDFEDMLDIKEALGYKRSTYQIYLREFIGFCKRNFPEEYHITKDIVESFLLQKNFSSNRTYNEVISKIRTFTKYQASIGKETFIPGDEYWQRFQRYIPYIFSDDELNIIFYTFDHMQPGDRAKNRDLIIPVLFRMIYCCGLRPTEPLRLTCEDVDLNTGEIYIRQTKGQRDRHLLMSKDMLDLCRDYNLRMGERTYFFEHWNSGPLLGKWVTNQFHLCIRDSGLKGLEKARPYDLRHTFATKTLMRWMDEKQDIVTMFPYLSAYMGHYDITGTLYYTHLIPERLRLSTGIDWDRFASIYPEVRYEEN